MRNLLIVTVVAVSFTLSCFADDADKDIAQRAAEAQARLEQKQAARLAAATRPGSLTDAATQPSSDAYEIALLKSIVADQRKQIDQLRTEIGQLRMENASLKKQVAANPIVTPPAGQKLAKGMTKDQLLDILGKPTMDQTDSDGSEHMEWNRLMQVQETTPVFTNATDLDNYIQTHTSTAPPVTEKTRWTLGRFITVELQNGKVVDFADRQQN